MSCENNCPTCKCTKTATIVGSGLVGSLWAIYMSKAGYKVSVFERRSDMRSHSISAGKSINLATSFRGWKALDEIGIGDEVRKIAIPMYGRTLHKPDGTTEYQPYGNADEAIYSVSRGAINAMLMDIAERLPNSTIHFNHECIDADLDSGISIYKNNHTGEVISNKADIVFATDGAFSAVRYRAMQKIDRFDYSQKYIPDGYKELLLPANEDGSYQLDKNSLHIWPRGRFMLIALPNFDGSFTCTLFMPFDHHEYCFSNLKNKKNVNDFFKEVFPDFFAMLPQVADEWDKHPLSSLAIIRCFPWTYGKFALMGDAAHATVPFFGQGMNCGFEDCSVMYRLMNKYMDNWPEVLREYEKERKPNGDAVQDLSLQNYIVMRDKVNDSSYLLLQKIERRINMLYPNLYFPMYSMVSFTDIPYSVALSKGNRQESFIEKLIVNYNIKLETSETEIDSIIHDSIENLTNL